MTGFILKLLAALFMVIDHFFKVLPGAAGMLPDFPIPIGGMNISVLALFSLLGRISFPLFAFLCAQGCQHTKNPFRHLKRLFVFALLSELPFDFAFWTEGTWRNLFSAGALLHQNVLFTFFLGALSVWLFDHFFEKKKPFTGALLVLSCIAAGRLLHTDYGSWGVFLVFALSTVKTKKQQALTLLLLLSWHYLLIKAGILLSSGFALKTVFNIGLPYVFSCLSVPLVLLYNGKQGHKIKWFFYWFYPLHLAILSLLHIWLPN